MSAWVWTSVASQHSAEVLGETHRTPRGRSVGGRTSALPAPLLNKNQCARGKRESAGCSAQARLWQNRLPHMLEEPIRAEIHGKHRLVLPPAEVHNSAIAPVQDLGFVVAKSSCRCLRVSGVQFHRSCVGAYKTEPWGGTPVRSSSENF